MITEARLRELFSYDPESGLFTRRSSRGPNRMGCIAGHCRKDGYVSIMVDGREYKAHRLAWLYTFGSFPVGELDHINRRRWDNRIANLRKATRSQNCAHSKTRRNGLKGAAPVSGSKNWQAQMSVNGKHMHLGCYPTEQEAHAAYMNAARSRYGEFAEA